MPLENHRDVTARGFGVDAGFQFEFFCQRCDHTWRFPFKPYRKGQFAGLVSRVSHWLGPLREHTRLAG
ncbi:MAG TPA: hypothetical protein PLF63_01645, partial [Rubrivivax sp.]|nr:hypothetical protein [Rubrivivax sp.]